MFIVTGGGSGIGKALAIHLANHNERVVIVGRRKDVLLETQAQAPNIEVFNADIATPEGRDTLVTFLSNKGPIKGLINNAGTLEPLLPMREITLLQWHAIMAINVEAPLFLTQALEHQLQQGRVLNISSGLAHFPAQSLGAYCVSKAALSMLTRCWQLESKDPLVASVMPGIIDTYMQQTLRNSQALTDENRHFYADLKQAGNLISPETVASFLSWLLLEVPSLEYTAQEWDIYDTSHHNEWLKPPHVVPSWN